MIRKYAVPLSLLLLLSLIILVGIGNYCLLNRDARILLDSVRKVQEAVEKDNWQEARTYFHETRSSWQKMRAYWPMTVHHQEMDRIEESMNKLKSYLRHENKTEAMAEMYNLIYFIKHIPQKEAFNLQNVF